MAERVARGEANPRPPPADSTAADEAICRICFAGADVGRLVSPCLCSGSMRFVHLDCLSEWRRRSANPKSHYQCENCLYRYSFRRAHYALVLRSALVGNPSVLTRASATLHLRCGALRDQVLHLVTLVLLILLIIGCSLIAQVPTRCIAHTVSRAHLGRISAPPRAGSRPRAPRVGHISYRPPPAANAVGSRSERPV